MRTTSMTLAFVAAALVAACSGGDRPPAADSVGEITPPPLPSADGGANEPGHDAGDDDCPPRTKRECMILFKTAAGKVQDCTQSIQWCRGDGHGWHKCGLSVEKPPD